MTGSISTAALLRGTTAGVVVLETLGLAHAARSAGVPKNLAASVAAGLCLWLGAAAVLAQRGVLADWTAMPPRWPLLPLIALGTFVLLGQTRISRRLLAEVPRGRPLSQSGRGRGLPVPSEEFLTSRDLGGTLAAN
jgi:hypothetical protein